MQNGDAQWRVVGTYFCVARWYTFSWERFSTMEFLFKQWWLLAQNYSWQRPLPYDENTLLKRASFIPEVRWVISPVLILPCASGFPRCALYNRSLLSGHSNCGSEEMFLSLSTTIRALHSSWGSRYLFNAPQHNVLFWWSHLIAFSFHSWLTVVSFGLILFIVFHYPCQVLFTTLSF